MKSEARTTSFDEFVELHNITTAPVNVGGWKFIGDSSSLFRQGRSSSPATTFFLSGLILRISQP
jgi:hypothetical protein